ncbi:MAG: cytochrome c oxidase subunit 4 [Flavobacteriales bacterium]|jgi:cytochrome c oxidase subunit 4
MVRDDLDKDVEYALSANHSEDHGIEIRKTVWKVTAILTAVTVFEVITGGVIKQYYDGVPNANWWMIKLLFIGLTLFKAAYIVLKFMHLGDETKSFKYILLTPYFLFMAYLIFILLSESTYINSVLF